MHRERHTGWVGREFFVRFICLYAFFYYLFVWFFIYIFYFSYCSWLYFSINLFLEKKNIKKFFFWKSVLTTERSFLFVLKGQVFLCKEFINWRISTWIWKAVIWAVYFSISTHTFQFRTYTRKLDPS